VKTNGGQETQRSEKTRKQALKMFNEGNFVLWSSIWTRKTSILLGDKLIYIQEPFSAWLMHYRQQKSKVHANRNKPKEELVKKWSSKCSYSFINEILAQVEHADYLQLIKSSMRRGLKLESSQKVKLFKLSIKNTLFSLLLFVKRQIFCAYISFGL
jgi:hypothetical protein